MCLGCLPANTIHVMSCGFLFLFFKDTVAVLKNGKTHSSLAVENICHLELIRNDILQTCSSKSGKWQLVIQLIINGVGN